MSKYFIRFLHNVDDPFEEELYLDTTDEVADAIENRLADKHVIVVEFNKVPAEIAPPTWPITDAQKDQLLHRLEHIGLRILEDKQCLQDVVRDGNWWKSYESTATYGARLTGHVMEREGFCEALRILNLVVAWDGDRPVDIGYDPQ